MMKLTPKSYLMVSQAITLYRIFQSEEGREQRWYILFLQIRLHTGVKVQFKGVASDTVISIFKQLPHSIRIKVKTITTDLSSAMILTTRKSFPHARLINARFHVQQLMSEAVDQIRIRRRWQALDYENKAIKKHRNKRKQAKTKAERKKIGEWIPIRMVNSETMPQIPARSKLIVLKNKSK